MNWKKRYERTLIKGINCDIEGMILEIVETKPNGDLVLKTIKNTDCKHILSGIVSLPSSEYSIGGIFKRNTKWNGCYEIINGEDK